MKELNHTFKEYSAVINEKSTTFYYRNMEESVSSIIDENCIIDMLDDWANGENIDDVITRYEGN